MPSWPWCRCPPSSRPALVARLVARMPTGFAWCKGESKTRGPRSFRKGAPYPGENFAALAAASGSRRAYKSPRRAPGGGQGARGIVPH